MPSVQIKVRESRFGLALVIESTRSSGGYVLGFRIDPVERLHQVTKDLQNLYSVHSEHPEFGVYYSVTTAVSLCSLFFILETHSDDSLIHYNKTMLSQPLLPEQPPVVPEEVVEFDETLNDLSNTLATYKLDQRNEGAGKPIFCPQLGLAVEKLSEDYTMQSLWEVLPSQTGSGD